MLQRMIPRRASAALAGAAIAVGAGIVLAPAAQAGTVTVTVKCTLPAGQGEFEGPQDITVDLSPAQVEAGGKVKAKVTLGPSPANSTQDLDDINITPMIDLVMHGGATGAVTVTGPSRQVDIRNGQPVPIDPYEGEFFVPANADGKIEFTIARTRTLTEILGGLETPCEVTAGADKVVADVTAGASTGGPATVVGPTGSVYPGSTFALTGANWTPSATPSISLCDAQGGACSGAKLTAPGLAIDAGGKLSGDAALAASGVADGSYQIKVTDGAKEASTPLTVKAFVPTGPRELTATPNKGPVGTTVTLTGKNYKANRVITLQALDATGTNVGNYVTGPRSSLGGEWTGTFTVTDPRTASILAMEGSNATNGTTVPFTVNDDLVQTVSGSVLPGSLAMSQAGAGIDLGSVTLNGTEQTMSGALNQVTVVDARSGNLGWSLTGAVTDLKLADASASIPAGNVSWTPACAAAEGSPSAVVSGSAGSLASAAQLCSQNSAASGVTGGKFTADAAIAVRVPAYAKPGTYTGSLTLSLS
ncbi:hypothetical protein [Streptomyces sp. SID3343]|uniref:hypothetical protein n=1 Tax=Streptomyces sp. SID3343 TaxID=2690260 RepID=UPI00136F73CE|nr:hypothetical protein [Streptomyces sp. SID3343]MYW02115.1 hypothetical protein [Streptomyces sp. SID3343]